MKNGTDEYIKGMFFALAIVLFVFGYYCFMQGRASVPNHGAGAATADRQLEQAGTTAQSITERASEVRQTGDRITSIVSDTGDTIADCKRILEGVRQRGKVEAVKN